MSELIFDSTTLSKLRQIHEPMEIRDEMGQLVGYFTPHTEHSTGRGRYGDVDVPFTDEELDRFEQEPGGRSLDEILKDLEARSRGLPSSGNRKPNDGWQPSGPMQQTEMPSRGRLTPSIGP